MTRLSTQDHKAATITFNLSGVSQTISCTFQEMRDDRLELLASERVSLSQAITVRYDDALFLGEVVTCVEQGNAWKLEVTVEQVLSNLQSLMVLRDRLLGEGVPQARLVVSMEAA